jgi:hypothetical protein
MQEEKINNLIHNIARAANIADEEIVRQAALRVIDDYGITDKLMLLERLYFFLADGQERRFIVTEFRKRVTEAQATLLENFRIEIQQGPGMA